MFKSLNLYRVFIWTPYTKEVLQWVIECEISVLWVLNFNSRLGKFRNPTSMWIPTLHTNNVNDLLSQVDR